MKTESIFESDRLICRAIQRCDLDDLSELFGDREVMRYFDICRTMSREETAAQIDVWLKHRDTYGFMPGVILLKESLACIGHGGLARYPGTDYESPELIYVLAKAHWGKGLATEFARAGLEYGFGVLDLDRIYATVRPENTASIRILEKVGMSFSRYVPKSNRLLYTKERGAAT